MSNISSVAREFKAFVLKGNIINMAVGVIIGGAFSKIITPLVNDTLIPPLGTLANGASSNTLKYVTHSAATVNGVGVVGTVILYGSLLQSILDLPTIGVYVSFMIRIAAAINSRLRHEGEVEEEAPVPADPTQEELLAEIRDLLKECGDIA